MIGSYGGETRRIDASAFVAAGLLVPPGAVVPPRTLVKGRPARLSRGVNDEDIEWILRSCPRVARVEATVPGRRAGTDVPEARLVRWIRGGIEAA